MRVPELPPEHPRAGHHDQLRRRHGVTWYSATSPVEDVLDHVLGLLDASADALEADADGYLARIRGPGEVGVLLAAAEGPRGSALSVWGLDDDAVALVDRIHQREALEVQEALRRGDYAGNPAGAWSVPVTHGEVVTETEQVGTALVAILDGADVVPLLPD